MFKGCSKLEFIELSTFRDNNLKYIAGMFEGCSSLKSLNLSHFITENVENMNSAFANCSSLITLPNMFSTNKAKTLNKMFYACESLEYLHLPYFDTSNINISDLESVFDDCYKLNLYIDVDKCKNLVSTIPSYVKIYNITDN